MFDPSRRLQSSSPENAESSRVESLAHHRSGAAPVHLSFITGAGFQSLQFEASTVVGRDASCDLRFDDGAASRRHAEIYRAGGLWWVRDLGSADGTYLDGDCVDAAPFSGAAELRLGRGGPTIWLFAEEPVDEPRRSDAQWVVAPDRQDRIAA